MRIGLLTDIYTPMINGVVNHILLLRQELEVMGHQVWVVSAGPADSSDDERVLRYGGLPLGTTGFFAGWPTQEHLWGVLRTMDVLHTHHPFLSGALALAAHRLSGAPLVFTNHTRYDIYSRIYAPYIPPFLADSPMHAWLRSMCDHCSAVIAPSEGVAEIMRGWGIRQEITVVPNGVQVERFRNVEPVDLTTLGVPEGAVVAAYVGRVSREKNMGALLQAFRNVATIDGQLHLLVLGDGTMLEEMKASARSSGLDRRVHFTGAVPYEQVPEWMAASDFFVSASISEVHPLVYIEAASAGLPALGIRSPGVSDTVVDGVTGLLSEDGGAGFEANLRRLAADADLRRRLGAGALQHSERYAVQKAASAISSIYERVHASAQAQS